jgi:hypothetical protein
LTQLFNRFDKMILYHIIDAGILTQAKSA